MNLLPQIYRKEIRKEKIFRASFMFFVLVSGVLFVGIILMLPSYFTLMFSATDVLRRWDVEKKTFDRQDVASFEEMITRINQRVTLYTNNENRRHRVTDLLVGIAGADNKEVRLTNINLRSETDGSFTFIITGTATTRDAFLSYVQRLKGVPQFSSVNYSISNLLRESDVAFELDISIHKESYFYEKTRS